MHLYLALRQHRVESRTALLPACPGLARLLQHGGTPSAQVETIAEWLAPRYGVARQIDWPLAPLLLKASGIDPGDGWWLVADPVTLVAGRDDVRFTGRVGDLAASDTQALLAQLNMHFAADGLAFVAPRPDRWFVRAPRPMTIATSALTRAIGQPLHPLQPQGADAGTWRRWTSEIEMLLYEHPVNVDRERRGMTSVNSVWFSAGGRLPPPDRSQVAPRSFAADQEIAALAQHAGSAHSPLPTQLASALAQAPRDRDLVIVIDDSTAAEQLEQRWTGPAWESLLRGDLAAVTIAIDDGLATRAWTTARPGWRSRLAGRFAPPDLAALLATGTRAE
jgi:hypothetical protein